MLGKQAPREWWARQGLNLRPHPCEGSAAMESQGETRDGARTDRDSFENIDPVSDHRLTTSKPRVIIAYSACPLTRAAFERSGCDAWTCDLLPARDGSPKHLQCNFWEVANDGWDFGLLHPMCTYLTVSAAWAFNDPDFDRYPGVGYHQKVKPETLTGKARRDARDEAIENFRRIMALPFPKVCENPGASFLSKGYRAPDQLVQPYEFGDDASKLTGLWKDACVPDLVKDPARRVPGRIVNGKERWANQTGSGQNRISPSDDRWLQRSETYPGLADAWGSQWGAWLVAGRHKPWVSSEPDPEYVTRDLFGEAA